jgi:hypothetical protein
MPTQLELEAQHRQEASEHNAQIATTKVTRGKADIFDGIVPAGQLPTSILPFEVVNVGSVDWFPTTTTKVIAEDSYNNKLVIAYLELEEDEIYDLTIEPQQNAEMFIYMEVNGGTSTQFRNLVKAKANKFAVIDWSPYFDSGLLVRTKTQSSLDKTIDGEAGEWFMIHLIWKNGVLLVNYVPHLNQL